MSSLTLEEVRRAAPQGRLWFQTYLWRDRSVVSELLDRAEAADYEALVVTVDVPRSADRRRDRRNGFGLPPVVTARALWGAATHPRWTARFLRDPQITFGNVAGRMGGEDAVSVAAYVNAQFDPGATWSDLEWLRRRWDRPLVVKGLLDPADARRAVDIGVQGIGVSNHGGRQLDQAPSTLEVLEQVAAEVGERAEVYLDGGVRRGSDVIKAIAQGATAVLAGRPLVFGLALGGRPGVDRVMEMLAEELRAAMVLAGIPAVADVDPAVVKPQPVGAR
jgi:L-lactate dehydrogenase (cytochrome)